MRNLCLDQCKSQGIRRHLQCDIIAVIPCPCYLGDGGRTLVGRTHDASILAGFEQQGFLLHFTPQHFGRIHYSIDQGLVPGAAAGVPVLLEPVAHIFTRRVQVGVQQGLGRHDEARAAEAALCPAVGHPGHLQRMKVVLRTQSLDGENLRIVLYRLHLYDTRPDDLAVHDNGA